MLRDLFSGVLGSRARCKPRGPRTRVTIPSVRAVSPDLLRQMRSYGDYFDYYVQRDGRVLLLEYRPNTPAMWEGRELLEWGIRTVDAHLMAAGFFLFDDLEPGALDNGRIVLRCRQIAFARERPHLVEAEHQRLLAETNGTAAEKRVEARWRDRLRAEEKSDYAIFFKHRHTVSGRSSSQGVSA